jgi:tRNA threonylcarbamoyladenosine biosynthesis protein TsaB
MIVLAVDTAGADCSAAVVRCIEGTTEPLCVRRDTLGRGHAEHLMPMIDALMGAAGTAFSDIDRFATTIGPGSFTGLRVGVSAIRGFALATGRPAVGVGSLEALAATALSQAQRESRASDHGTICAALDARHGNVYAQVFDAEGAALCPPQAIAAHQAVTLPPFTAVTGTGASAIAAHLEGHISVRDAGGCPDPVVIARLSAARSADDAPPKPLYLKPPDAAPAPPPLPRQPHM